MYESTDYKYGFVTEIESEVFPPGLNEEIVRAISAKKNEPEFMLNYRLKAFKHWQKMKIPGWANLKIPDINFQDIIYYAAPVQKPGAKSDNDIDSELSDTFNKLGIPLNEQKQLTGTAVDAIMDSASVKTTFKDSLAELGIIFCSFSEAVQKHPGLIKKYLGTIVPYGDNFYSLIHTC